MNQMLKARFSSNGFWAGNGLVLDPATRTTSSLVKLGGNKTVCIKQASWRKSSRGIVRGEPTLD